MNRPLRIAAFAGSTRRGSLNRKLIARLAELAAEEHASRAEIDVIDLRGYPLPIYDGDTQARDGIPHAAVAIHDRIAAADAVIVAIPEYNGGYPALFKNVIDWVSRVDMFVFLSRYVGIVAASPGGGGGKRGADHTAALFANMFVTSHETLAVPAAHESVADDDQWIVSEQRDRVARWLTEFIAAASARVVAQEQAKAGEQP